ncbi:MAG: hypothetical protein Q8N51_11520 [Gammaproteobacteria bacterium]|nr:hypothetical protein [Gammaproteobacteria bacterium]
MRNTPPGTLAGALTRSIPALLATVLVACGGGGVGGGQDPDPVALDVAIAYVKRPVPVDNQGAVQPSDVRELRTFNVGADLFVRERAAVSAAEINVTDRITQGSGLYDVRDLEASFDGTRVVFAMRGPFEQGAAEEDQPTWNIWEYTLGTDVLRRVISSDLNAGAGHDVGPHYLPDGRIVFSSTRQRQSKAILLDEGKPQFEAEDEDRNEPAFVLHVMNADGSDIHQISFNQSHDLDPTVLANGQVLFSRWDNAAGNTEFNLYRMNPDGTGLELYYGNQSHATGTNGATIQFVQPREMPDGRILTIVRPFQTDEDGGDLVAIDAGNFVENLQPTAPNAGLLAGPAQSRVVVNDVRTDDTISPGGEFASAYPLFDGTSRMFVSWTPCRLLDASLRVIPCSTSALADPNAVAAPPLYGIWVYDLVANTQAPVFAPTAGLVISDIVAAQPRATPPVIFDLVSTGLPDPDLVAEGAGLIDIRSVYDLDGTASVDIGAVADPAVTLADQRQARFLRLEKPVSLPDDDVRDFDNSAFGVSQAQGMREILGYVPVEPDGSVVARVPANVAIALSVLDANGRRITGRHQNWLQVRPGEVLSCNGCHVTQSGVSHGRREAFVSAWGGATLDGQPFPNTESAFFADFGETMAQVKQRISCATDCAMITPSVDVVYDDIWTDPVAAGRAKDTSFAYRYADLTTPLPTPGDCLTAWSPRCRITINYEAHIHPLWAKPRVTLDVDGITVLADNTCTTCHNPDDPLEPPAGQLDLTDGLSDINADHFKAYRELLSGDNEQIVVDGVLQDRLIEVGVDPVTGAPILVPVAVNASMSTAGARSSPNFFNRFAPAGTHAGRLTPAELRLLSEWVDIGAQYYNDPFQAPLN